MAMMRRLLCSGACCRLRGPSALALAARLGSGASAGTTGLSASAAASVGGARRLSSSSTTVEMPPLVDAASFSTRFTTSDVDIVPPAQLISSADLAALRQFVLAHPRVCLLTGAGMSTAGLLHSGGQGAGWPPFH